MAVAIAAGLAAAGSIVSGIGTANAQSQANKAGALAAAQQSAQAFQNYLSSRGVNLQQIVANHPELTAEYNRVHATGDKRDFNTWLHAALVADPNNAVWNDIANPSAGNGAQNTTQPNYVTIGGQPAQPVVAGNAGAIYQNATGQVPIGQIATLQNVQNFLQANPLVLSAITSNMAGSDDQRTPQQWLVDHITQTEGAAGGGTFTNLLKSYLSSTASGGTGVVTQAPPAGSTDAFVPVGNAGSPATPHSAVDQKALDAQNAAVNVNLTNLLNGTTGAANQAELQKALDARTQAAALQQTLLDQQRAGNANINATQLSGLANLLGVRTAGAGSIYDATAAGAQGINTASLAGLANLLGVRQQGAQDIFGASTQAAGGLRSAQQESAQGISAADLAGLSKLLGVQTNAAQNVYGAQLTQADTYGQGAQQALQQQLAQQQAQRARQGFIGSSSGSDLERARLMAQYLQVGAGARAGAGVSLQQALGNAQTGNAQSQLQDAINLATAIGQANTGYAANVGAAGVNRATQLGSAREQNSLGQLQSGVNLATSLAGAGTTRATSVAQAGEQNASGQLAANTQLATSNAGLNNATADIAKQQAAFQNAMDQLNLALNNQQLQLGASGAPSANATNNLNVQNLQSNALYDAINAFNRAVAPFQINQASGPQVTTFTPQPVINPAQIIGGALTSAGQVVGSNAGSQDIWKILASLGGSSGGAPSSGVAQPAASGSGYLLGQSPVFQAGANPFAGPCWIARTVYGESSPKWVQFRDWLMNRAGPAIRDFYLRHGPAIAERIRGDIGATLFLRNHFDAVLAAN